MLRMSIAWKFRSSRKWANAGFYDSNKQSYVTSIMFLLVSKVEEKFGKFVDFIKNLGSQIMTLVAYLTLLAKNLVHKK